MTLKVIIRDSHALATTTIWLIKLLFQKFIVDTGCPKKVQAFEQIPAKVH